MTWGTICLDSIQVPFNSSWMPQNFLDRKLKFRILSLQSISLSSFPEGGKDDGIISVVIGQTLNIAEVALSRSPATSCHFFDDAPSPMHRNQHPRLLNCTRTQYHLLGLVSKHQHSVPGPTDYNVLVIHAQVAPAPLIATAIPEFCRCQTCRPGLWEWSLEGRKLREKLDMPVWWTSCAADCRWGACFAVWPGEKS
jgi:hypothetical protein